MNMISPARALTTPRQPVATAHKKLSEPVVFPAPSAGLVTSQNLAVDVPSAAIVLNNFIPTERGARLSKGHSPYAALDGGDDVVQLFAYRDGSTEKMFASTATAIFDVSSPSSATFEGLKADASSMALKADGSSTARKATTVASSVVSGLSGGDWHAVQQTNSGGTFTVIANGADHPYNYDGSTWQQTPAITGVTGGAATLNSIWTFGERLFFTQNNTLDAYYLGVLAIGGAATAFPLGGVMKKGGSLLLGFSWSIDSGDGPDDLCCFVSTEGEVAVYSGTDPASASTFVKKGVYNIPKPSGKHAVFQAGGDVLIGTDDGLIPMSQVFNKAQLALRQVAVSKSIENEWTFETASRGSNWQIGIWKDKALGYISMPEATGADDVIFVLNLITGAWGKIPKQWNARCWETLNENLYFGSVNGNVFRADHGGSDNGVPIQGAYLSTFQSGGNLGQLKKPVLASMEVLTNTKANFKLFCRTDDDETLPAPPTVSACNMSGGWDVDQWDVGIWDASSAKSRERYRQSVTGIGESIAFGCMVVVDCPNEVEAEILLSKVQIEPAELMV